MEINENIIFEPNPRKGWAEAANEMHASGDDLPLPEEAENDFDKEEWTW